LLAVQTPAVPANLSGDQEGTPGRGARDWLFALALVIAIVLAYQPAWHGAFIWDDDQYVTENPLLTSREGLRRIWFSLDSPSQYFPLTYTTFYLERPFWGLNPAGYHWVNILLHAGNALLVWQLLTRLRVPGAWLAAAVFALHPVQVESVAWITERKNVLMAFFFLLTLLAWVKFIGEKTARPWRFYLVALVCYALALSAKTTACTLPAALLLILWLERKPIGWRRLAQVGPFLAMGIGMGLVTVWWERYHQGTHGKLFAIGWAERGLIASRAVWFYAGKLLWPANLTFSYPRWTISASDPAAYGWALATAALGVAVWRARRWAGRGVEVAAAFFAVTLSPVLGFIMLYTFVYSFVADHYQYVACLGPIALAAAGMERGLGRMGKQTPFFQPVCCGALLVLLWALTWQQCGMYADSETLWRTTLARNAGSWIAHDNLGVAFDQKGELEEAIGQYRKALEINPGNLNAHNNLGKDLVQKGEMGEAVAQYREALEINPDFAEVRYNLAFVLARMGRAEEAIAQYRKALDINPAYVDARNNLGRALLQKGEVEEAIAQFRKALEINPAYMKARKNLGNALLRKGDFDGAMACFEKITALSPDPVERWFSLGDDFLQHGELEEAIACFRQTLKIRPRFADASANLGLALFQKGEMKEAIAAWQQALEINPAHLYAQNNLAWLLATASDASLRDGAKAVALAEQANQLTGGANPVILHTLAAAYAEAGRYGEASATARRALELAGRQKNDKLGGTLQKEIKLYEAGSPARDAISR
jgi:tetratricopeptide (TPR) repeat protein